MSSIIVTPNLQTKSVSSSTSAQTITPDSGYCRLRQVNISAFSGKTVSNIGISFQKSDFTYNYNSYDTVTPYWYNLDSTKQLSDFPQSYTVTITDCSCSGQYNSYSVSFWGGTGSAFCIYKNQSIASSAQILVFNSSTRQDMYRGNMSLTFNVWPDNSKYTLGFAFDNSGYNYFKQLPSDSEIYISCACY